MSNLLIKPRIKYIDLIKAFAIFVVVWGHTIQYLSNDNNSKSEIYGFIYSFHMPLFMMISGFFFSSGLKLSFFSIMKKKAQQLLLPVVSWSVTIGLFLFIINWFINKRMPGLYSSLNDTALSIKDSLWFLKSCFSCYIVSYIGVKLFKKEWIACISTILFFLLFPSPFMERFMLPFFWIGIFLKKHYSFVEKHRTCVFSLTLTFFAMLFFWNEDYTIGRSPLNNILNIRTFSFNFMNLDIAVFRLFIGAMGSLFFVFIFRHIYRDNKIYNSICKVGKHTLGIYILQFYILEKGLSCLKMPDINPIFYNLIATPFASIVIILICLLCLKIIKKNKYLNFFYFGSLSAFQEKVQESNESTLIKSF